MKVVEWEEVVGIGENKLIIDMILEEDNQQIIII